MFLIATLMTLFGEVAVTFSMAQSILGLLALNHA
jgi:hypothetical protein